VPTATALASRSKIVRRVAQQHPKAHEPVLVQLDDTGERRLAVVIVGDHVVISVKVQPGLGHKMDRWWGCEY